MENRLGSLRMLVPVFLIVILLFIGFVLSSEQQNNVKQNVSVLIGKTFSENSIYNLSLGNNRVSSFSLDGNFKAGTIAEVYLVNNNSRYMVLDSLSNFDAVNLSSDISSSLNDIFLANLSYGMHPSPALVGSMIDFYISSKILRDDLDYEHVCTRWDYIDQEKCFGNSECCLFLGLESYGEWNSSFGVSSSDALESNASAILYYFDYNLSSDSPYALVYNSENVSLPAVFYDSYSFSNACVDSCMLNELAGSDYKLNIVVDSGEIYLDKAEYSVFSNRLGVMSSNENSTLNLTWGDALGFTTAYVLHSLTFMANFSNTSSLPILNAQCNISYSDGVSANMSYSSSTSVYYHIRNFSISGNYSYNASCNKSEYGTLNEAGNITIETPNPGFSSTDLSNPGTSTSLVWADYNNDDWWDLVYTGSNGRYMYRNSNGALSADSTYSFDRVQDGSIGFADIDNDGDLDMGLTGIQSTTRMAKIYGNNGSSLNEIQNLTQGADLSSLVFLDMNWDGYTDIIQQGKVSGTTRNFTIYQNNVNSFVQNSFKTGINYGSISWINNLGTNYLVITGSTSTAASGALLNISSLNNFNLNFYQNLTRRYYSTSAVADLDNDGDLDIIVSGSSTSATTYLAEIYYWNGSSFNLNQTLPYGLIYPSMSVGDINNDGRIDFVLTGQNGSNQLSVYINNGSNFVDNGNYSIEPISSSSIAMFDYDNDGDLDLAISGNSLAKLYTNNVSSITRNYAPNAPTSFQSSFNNGQLSLSWGNGSDDITPTLGLYYNLRVGTLPNGNDVVSGKYSTSSNPTQGYLGNMMQAKNYTLNLTNEKTYYWQIQTIDGGLKSSSWSSVQEYTPNDCVIPSNSDWLVNATCTKANQVLYINGSINITKSLQLFNVTLLMNNSDNTKGIYLKNGSLIINDSIIKSNNQNTFSFFINQSTSFSIYKSYLNDSLGLEINASNVNLNKIYLKNNSYAVYLHGSNISIADSVIQNNKMDITNFGDNNNLTNVTFDTKIVSAGSLYVKYYLEAYVTGEYGENVSSVNITGYNNNSEIIDSKLTNTNGYAKLSLIGYIANISDISYNNYTVQFRKNLLVTQNISINMSSNQARRITMDTSDIPITDGFDSELTTDFSIVNDLENVSNARVGKNNLGQISWLVPINVSGLNLTRLIQISYNSISLDSASAPRINYSANLTLFNLTYAFNPTILKNNIICSECTILNYSNSNLTFNTTGFSVYNTTSNSKLSLSYSNNVNQRPTLNEKIFFYANYTNYTSDISINGTNINCSIQFGDAFTNMTFNTTLFVYQFNKTFSSSGTYYYNISCDGTNRGYEMINLSSSITIKVNSSLFEVDSRQSLEGLYKWSSLVIDDIDNDNYKDIILSGQTEDSSDTEVTYWYFNNNSLFNLTYSGLIKNLTMTSISLEDYDKDGDLDAFINGYDGTSGNSFLILKND
jgi:hypothetical protein